MATNAALPLEVANVTYFQYCITATFSTYPLFTFTSYDNCSFTSLVLTAEWMEQYQMCKKHPSYNHWCSCVTSLFTGEKLLQFNRMAI